MAGKAVRLGHAPRSSFSAARGRFPVAVLLSAVRRKGSVPIVVPCGTGRAHGPGGDAVFRTERKGPAPSRNGKPFPGETLRRPFSAAGRRRSAAPLVRRDRPVPVPRAFRAVRAVPGGRAEGLVPDAFPQQGDFLLPPKRRPGNAVTSSQPSKNAVFLDHGEAVLPGRRCGRNALFRRGLGNAASPFLRRSAISPEGGRRRIAVRMPGTPVPPVRLGRRPPVRRGTSPEGGWEASGEEGAEAASGGCAGGLGPSSEAPDATSSSIPQGPCPGPSRRACAWRGGCTGGRAAGRCRRSRRDRTPDRSRCARRGNAHAARTPRTD